MAAYRVNGASTTKGVICLLEGSLFYDMRKKILLIMAAILTLSLSACNKEPETIRLGAMPTYSASIYAVGIEKGFFLEAGAAVELTVFRSARDRDGAATAGQLDGFMTDIMGAVNLNAKGFPHLMTSREYDDFGVMAGPAVDMRTIENARTGIGENTVVEYIADTYLTDQRIEKVSIPALPDRMGALLGGELDYGVFPQPFVGIILGNGGQVVLSTAEKQFHPVVVVFDKVFVEKNRDAVDAFYEGYENTVAYMQENSYDNYKDALVTHGLATAETVDFYRLPVDRYGVNPVRQEDYDAVTEWMLGKGLLDKAIPFGDVVETR